MYIAKIDIDSNKDKLFYKIRLDFSKEKMTKQMNHAVSQGAACTL